MANNGSDELKKPNQNVRAPDDNELNLDDLMAEMQLDDNDILNLPVPGSNV